MFRRAALTGGLSVLLIASAGVGSPSATAKAHAQPGLSPRTSVLIPAVRGERIPTRGGTMSSLNWSGYAVSPASSVTAVASTFAVPAAGLIPPGFAATWTGIGGFRSKDLIQAGIAENSLASNALFGPQYYAWIEMLPAAETPIENCSPDPNCTVAPGQRVTVKINNTGGNAWTVGITDAGHWSWSQSFTYASSRSSAEWILEAPQVVAQTVLAPVGTVHFGSTSTYTAGGATRTIAEGNPTLIELTPSPIGGVDEATPSALASDGQSFNDCAYQTSCPRP